MCEVKPIRTGYFWLLATKLLKDLQFFPPDGDPHNLLFVVEPQVASCGKEEPALTYFSACLKAQVIPRHIPLFRILMKFPLSERPPYRTVPIT
jgi:hypothetical protein